MRIRKATFKRSGALAFAAVLGLLMTTVSPATAVTVAAGAGSGWEYPPPSAAGQDPCEFFPVPPDELPAAHFENDTFVLGHHGTFEAATEGQALPTAAYLGGTNMTITVEAHYISPVGTHPDLNGDPSVCPDLNDPATLGPVEVRAVRIEGEADFVNGPFIGIPPGTTTEDGSVDCSGDSGQYQRVSSAVLFVLEVDCTIEGNVTPLVDTVRVEDVLIVVEGTMNPCWLAPPVDLTVNPECTLSGPEAQDAGAHLVTAYEAVEASPLA